MKRTFLAILPLGVLIVIGCGGSKGGNVASINGEVITKDEFYKEMLLRKEAVIVVDPRNLQSQGSNIPPQAVSGAIADGNLGFETLKSLIGTKLTMQLAADQGVTPTKADIDASIEEIKRENPMQLNNALSQGLSLDYIRAQIAFALAKEKIVTRGVTITPKQIDDYIKSTPDDPLYYQPAKVSVQYIVVKAADEPKVDSDFAAGKAFELVANQYSLDKTGAQYSYYLGGGTQATPSTPVAVTAFSKQVQDIVGSVGEGQYSKWILDGKQAIKFYVSKKIAPKTLPIDADMRKKLTRGLAMREGSRGIDLDKQVMDKLKASKVVVNDEVLRPMWDSFEKNLKNQAKPTGLVPGAAPTATAVPSASPSASPSGH